MRQLSKCSGCCLRTLFDLITEFRVWSMGLGFKAWVTGSWILDLAEGLRMKIVRLSRNGTFSLLVFGPITQIMIRANCISPVLGNSRRVTILEYIRNSGKASHHLDQS